MGPRPFSLVWLTKLTLGRPFTRIAMAMGSFPMDFSNVSNNEKITVVVDLITFDPSHESHLLQLKHTGTLCFYCGLMEGGFSTYTICDALVTCQFPMPRMKACDSTRILSHARPGWNDFRKLVDACAGFGGIAHGAGALGIRTTVAVDTNDRMLSLHSRHDDCHVVVGDVGFNETIVKVWERSDNAAIMSSGFSCQPYSVLGDQRGAGDPRSASLTSVLRAAYMLQIQVLVLECVTPARRDPFVVQSIDHFASVMNYRIEVVDLCLESVWSCKRSRTWWVVYNPSIGPLGLHEWPELSNVEHVHRLIPYISRWHPQDELALALDSTEMEAFGGCDDTYHASAPSQTQREGTMPVACLRLTTESVPVWVPYWPFVLSEVT